MNLQVNVSNLDLTDQIKKIIISKFEEPTTRLLGKFDASSLSAVFHLERLSFGDYQANFEMVFPGKKNIYAKNRHPDLMAAITGLREQVEKQIKKCKE